MDRLYHFSPITSREQFDLALDYIARESMKLVQQLCSELPPLESVRVFAHYPEEYRNLEEYVTQFGPRSQHQPTTGMYVDCHTFIADQAVQRIGIRPADPYRAQVGHADFVVDSFESFRSRFMPHPDNFVRDMPGREGKLIELWHPDFDVTAYIIRSDYS